MVGIIVFLVIVAMSMTAMNVHDWYTRKEIEKYWREYDLRNEKNHY
ncbi:hypothetical protein [Periweissella fabalis]|uniref:Uncharacterized protein n=1 Tax=Periweissella fabalis TaxID=1070421 RepID=A0A7X6N2L9_9LACO|nr:hypothetical protein [Periweissella fabalis]MCM0599195.1 hypothetical protein [Periweissella fabalis]NKZ23474.1 hypothetical protein [Periweissella fabalis]